MRRLRGGGGRGTDLSITVNIMMNIKIFLRAQNAPKMRNSRLGFTKSVHEEYLNMQHSSRPLAPAYKRLFKFRSPKHTEKMKASMPE